MLNIRVNRVVCLLSVAVVGLLATSCTPVKATDYDFDGDGRADHVWIDNAGDWRRGPTSDNVVIGHMDPNAAFVPGDYDGDGRVEVASVGADGNWITSGSAGTIAFPRPDWPIGVPQNGGNQRVPVPGRYADGTRDVPAWYREIDGMWFIQGMAPIQFGNGPTTPGTMNSEFAVDEDLPVPADYDGDGITDLAVYNPRTGSYRIRSSIDSTVSDRTLLSTAAGDPLILPVPGDYDHVGHAQAAVWGSITGWVIEGHTDPIPFGVQPPPPHTISTPFSFPVPADYDGDGATDMTVIWSDGRWEVRNDWIPVVVPWAGNGADVPVEFTVARLWSVARFTLVGRCVNHIGC